MVEEVVFIINLGIVEIFLFWYVTYAQNFIKYIYQYNNHKTLFKNPPN